MIFVSSHHGHARGTLCFSLAPGPLGATATAHVAPVTSAPLCTAPFPMSRGHRPAAPFSLQETMSDRSKPSQDSPSPAPDAGRGGALRQRLFPIFMFDIAQSDDADRLLWDLNMLKDDAVEAANEAVRALDPALSDLCDALRWTATDGNIQAITDLTRAWTPRGLLLTATVAVATSPSEVKVIEHVPLALAQGSSLVEYVSKDPDALTASLVTRRSRGHAPNSAARLRHLVFLGLYTAREKAPHTRPTWPCRFRVRRSLTRFTSPSASSYPLT